MDPWPLHAAVGSRDLAEVASLLADGGHPHLDSYDEAGHTPLLLAVFLGFADVAEALLKAGANPNKLGASGDSPLWHAEDDFGLEDVSKVLKRYGARKLPSEDEHDE